jgi:very-short-patch-repair endonuclease
MASPPSNEPLLVGIVQSRGDLTCVDEGHWYRVPVKSVPKTNWPPKWFAVLEASGLDGEPQQVIRRFAEVVAIEERTREELFPGMPAGDRAGKRYYKLKLANVTRRDDPIRLHRARRHAFIPTTFAKFERATSVNDLFDESPMEDELWEALKSESIPAERQWRQMVRRRRFFIDFALFCTGGPLAVEVDGTWHHNPEKAIKDDERDRLLATEGWQMHHIATRRIQRALREEMEHLKEVINRKGGLVADGFVPRKFVGDDAVQFALFEPRAGYDLEPADDEDD